MGGLAALLSLALPWVLLPASFPPALRLEVDASGRTSAPLEPERFDAAPWEPVRLALFFSGLSFSERLLLDAGWPGGVPPVWPLFFVSPALS